MRSFLEGAEHFIGVRYAGEATPQRDRTLTCAVGMLLNVDAGEEEEES